MSDDLVTSERFEGGEYGARRRTMPTPRQLQVQTQQRDQAEKLATHLYRRGIRPGHLEKMHPNILAHHAMSAGVNNPGQDVWGLAHQMLSFQEQEDVAKRQEGTTRPGTGRI